VCELPGMEAYRGDALKRQIRVRHLLQHTSGLPSYQEYFKGGKAACNDPEGGPPSCADPELDLGPTIPWVGAPGLTNECVEVDGKCRPARTLTLDKVSSYVMQTYSPYFQPGSKFSLSEMAFTVAARIVEHLTGKSVNIYLKEKLFKPLGMKDTFFVAGKTGDKSVDDWMDEGVTDEQRGRIPDLAVITRDGKFPSYLAPGPENKWDKFKKGWRYLEVSGGMYSTAGDLLAYLRMLRDGGMGQGKRVLSTEIVDLLVKDQGFGHTMGFGYTDDSKRHGPGAQTLMHLGGFITFFWYDKRPAGSLLGVFLSQRITDISTLTDGTNVVFKVFTPRLEAEVFGPKPGEPA
jgi:CubicO group peptidase (beta-lactamase class C family)